MVSSFKEYLEYMNGAQYFTDGNPVLEKKGFISKTHPEKMNSHYILHHTKKNMVTQNIL